MDYTEIFMTWCKKSTKCMCLCLYDSMCMSTCMCVFQVDKCGRPVLAVAS